MDLLPYIIGVGVGYFTASYLIGRHIDNKVERALTLAMVEVAWVFTNTQTGETYDVAAGKEASDSID